MDGKEEEEFTEIFRICKKKERNKIEEVERLFSRFELKKRALYLNTLTDSKDIVCFLQSSF